MAESNTWIDKFNDQLANWVESLLIRHDVTCQSIMDGFKKVVKSHFIDGPVVRIGNDEVVSFDDCLLFLSRTGEKKCRLLSAVYFLPFYLNTNIDYDDVVDLEFGKVSKLRRELSSEKVREGLITCEHLLEQNWAAFVNSSDWAAFMNSSDTFDVEVLEKSLQDFESGIKESPESYQKKFPLIPKLCESYEQVIPEDEKKCSKEKKINMAYLMNIYFKLGLHSNFGLKEGTKFVLSDDAKKYMEDFAKKISPEETVNVRNYAAELQTWRGNDEIGNSIDINEEYDLVVGIKCMEISANRFLKKKKSG